MITETSIVAVIEPALSWGADELETGARMGRKIQRCSGQTARPVCSSIPADAPAGSRYAAASARLA